MKINKTVRHSNQQCSPMLSSMVSRRTTPFTGKKSLLPVGSLKERNWIRDLRTSPFFEQFSFLARSTKFYFIFIFFITYSSVHFLCRDLFFQIESLCNNLMPRGNEGRQRVSPVQQRKKKERKKRKKEKSTSSMSIVGKHRKNARISECSRSSSWSLKNFRIARQTKGWSSRPSGAEK
jgi:hypothetical protein